MGKVYQLVRFESDDETCGVCWSKLLDKIGITDYGVEIIKECLTGSSLVAKRWTVMAWITTTDIPKLEEVLANETSD